MLLKQKGGGRKEGEREEMRHRGLLFMGKIKERGVFWSNNACLGVSE